MLLNMVTRLGSRLAFRPREDVTEFRDVISRMERRRKGKPAEEISIQDLSEPVPGRWQNNSFKDSGKVILDLHGGAFILRHPEDIAIAVLYLASDESQHPTGEAIVVDGGSLI